LNEKDIIRKYFTKQLNDQSVIEGIGDDAAIVKASSGHELVITTDMMVEGRHFTRYAPAFGVGYKLMASNLSDLAAMGASPRWATLNITLSTLNQSWLEEFSNGLLTCAKKHNVTLIGGDTTRGNQLNVAIQLIGEVPKGKAMLRSGAKADDRVFVSGAIGNAAAALDFLRNHDFSYNELTEKQFSALYMPPSRVELGMELREIANACIDISDGLLNELEIICDASKAGALLQLDCVPHSQNVNIMSAITGGEDYELLFTVPEDSVNHIDLLSAKYYCELSEIGRITNTMQVELYQGNQIMPHPKSSGYDHFNKIVDE
tara:strand:- start:769 stop:1722 length:954 start_codon:yes stop_codon:yes gene_type:complete